MPNFSKRRMNNKILYILKKVGRVVACYQQIANFANELANRVPADPYQDDLASTDDDYKIFYIFAAFQQDEAESFEQAGKMASITGTLTIPWIYRAYIAQTAYFDPFLNGSKFIKVGAQVDDESVLITQRVKSLYLPQSPEV